jgi:hypothetical protein
MKRYIERSNATTRLALTSLLALTLTTGCLFNVGNATIAPPTVGKQLIDLEQARKDKLVSEEEYEKLRKRIIEQGPVPEGVVPRDRGGDERKDSD